MNRFGLSDGLDDDRPALQPPIAPLTVVRRAIGLARILLKQRIDEWRHHGALRQDDKASKQHENSNDGEEPELFSLPHKRPEL